MGLTRRFYGIDDNGGIGTGGSGTSDHSALSNLDFASSGHTGFAPDQHTIIGTHGLADQPLVDGSNADSLHTHTNFSGATFEGDTNFNGNIFFGSNIISGTGNIYAGNIYAENEYITNTEIIQVQSVTDDLYVGDTLTVSGVSNFEGNIYYGNNLISGTGDIYATNFYGTFSGTITSGTIDHDDLANVTPNQHHDELHTIASHSDTDATGPELDSLTDGSNADSLHTHTSFSGATFTGTTIFNGDIDFGDNIVSGTGDIYANNIYGTFSGTITSGTIDHDDLANVTPNQHHDELHTIASHSDTSATGPELDSLTDGSNADSLHTHTSFSGATFEGDTTFNGGINFGGNIISGSGDIYAGNIYGTISGTIISGTINHNELNNLDYSVANHTGFVSIGTTQTVTGSKTFTQTIITSNSQAILPTASGAEDIGSAILPYEDIYSETFYGVGGSTDGGLIVLGSSGSAAASYAEIFDGGFGKPGYIIIYTDGGVPYYLSLTSLGGFYLDTSIPTGSGISNIEFGSSDVTIKDGDLYVSQNILPTVSGSSNLGSLSYPFNDLYLTGGSIYIGGVKLEATVVGNQFHINTPTVISGGVTIPSGAGIFTGDGSGLYNIDHDNLGNVTPNQHHDELHTIASHSDTSATGPELDTLTDGSSADSLHYHDYSNISGTIPSGALPTHYHDDRYYTETEIDALLSGTSISGGDHSLLANLDYDSSGHVGFSPFYIHTDTEEPTGFVNRTDSSYSFNDTTRTFSISGTYEYYIKGIKYTKSGTDSFTMPAEEGDFFFYFDGTTLTGSNSFFADIITDYAYTANMYWDNTNSGSIYLGEERHGITMDGSTHSYLHVTRGTQWAGGLDLVGFEVDEIGDQDSHAQFGNSSGVIRDEDIIIPISADSTPGQYPIFYKVGSSGDWRRDAATNFPVKSYVGGSGRLAWNEWTGSTWQQTEVDNGDFVCCHIFATNDLSQPIIAVQGQVEYDFVVDARIGAPNEISNMILTGMPFQEFRPLGTVIYRTLNTMTNSVKAAVRSTDEGDDYIDLRTIRETSFISTAATSDHGGLTGLSDDDHLQYLRTNGTRQLSGNWNYGSYNISGTGDIYANSFTGDGSGLSGIDHDNLSNVTANQHHDELHTIASHSDTDATGSELDTLTDGSDADSLHYHNYINISGTIPSGALPVHYHVESDITDLIHDAIRIQGRTVYSGSPNDGDILTWNTSNNRWEPTTSTSGVNPHTIASHIDTDATGAQLNTLTNGSNADSLHTHTSFSGATFYGDTVYSGNIYFGDNIISGTGDIYINNIYGTFSGTITSGTINHAELLNLDYASSGHTGFAPDQHTIVSTHGSADQPLVDGSNADTLHYHDYSAISGTDHNHDDLYYTESEIDTISGSLQSQIDNHTHVTGDVTDLQEYIEDTIGNSISGAGNVTIIYDDLSGTITVSGSGSASISGGDHSLLNNLDFSSSGHTGFAPDQHTIIGTHGLADQPLVDGSNADSLHTHTNFSGATFEGDTNFNGNIFFGSNIISGTGNIYAGNIYAENEYITNTEIIQVQSVTDDLYVGDTLTVSGVSNFEGNIYYGNNLISGTGDIYATNFYGNFSGTITSGTVDHDDLANVTPNQHHSELHTIASHSDTSATGPELDSLTDGSNADSLHTHTSFSGATFTGTTIFNGDIDFGDNIVSGTGDIYATDIYVNNIYGTFSGTITSGTVDHDDLANVTPNQHHDELHTIASHSDTSATGPELDSLTDGSNADSLHYHNYANISGTLPSGIADHGLLTGLSDDDHSQYLLADGTRQLSGDWGYGSQSISGTGDVHVGELSIKVYNQTSEPTLSANNNLAIWVDTDDSNAVYLVFRRGSGDQVAVELTN